MSAMSMPVDHLSDAPVRGEAITMAQGRLQVPATPIIPFIEGDGTGPDIWRASRFVFDNAVERAYGAQRKIVWLEGLAGGAQVLAFMSAWPVKAARLAPPRPATRMPAMFAIRNSDAASGSRLAATSPSRWASRTRAAIASRKVLANGAWTSARSGRETPNSQIEPTPRQGW